jgi:glutathionylspermidine synthase
LRVDGDDESKGTAEYLERLARTAGAYANVGAIDTFHFRYSSNNEESYPEINNKKMDVLMKMYPMEWIAEETKNDSN